jgi:rod shape-determining protein MreC
MAVLTADGLLVGRINQVGLSTAQVVLVGDPNCRVAAFVQETRDNGIIEPGTATVLDPSLVDLTHLDRNSSVRPGHHVLTSGLGGVFPQGIMLGQIIETNSIGFGLYCEAKVKLAANLRHLEEVWVKFP